MARRSCSHERKHMTAAKLRLYARLQSAAHLMKKTADRALMDAAGVTTAQAAVLAIVAREANADTVGPTQKLIAQQLGLNESAVTAMANRLITLNYLKREKDPQDRRAWRLALTRQGKTAIKRIREPFGEINTQIETALGADNLEEFAEGLSALGNAFKD